jgi:putative transposase
MGKSVRGQAPLAPLPRKRDIAIVPQLRTPPRLPFVNYSSPRVFFVTFCVWDRRQVFASPAAAGAMRDILLRYREREWYWLLSYCIMPDHVHMLLKPRSFNHNLSRTIATIKHESMKGLKRIGETIRWKYGYYDKILRGNDSEFGIAHYITQNPVRAGLVREASDYRWCGIVDQFW